MAEKSRPISIENDWSLLYTKYPEGYDAFARAPIIQGDTYLEVMNNIYSFTGMIVADIGSGSGLSSFQISKCARYVYGIEPEENMKKIALNKAHESHIENVEFLGGTSEEIPLIDNSVDIVSAITLASNYNEENITKFIKEAERVVRKGGLIFSVNIAPNSYGGELYSIIEIDKGELVKHSNERASTFKKFGFVYHDYYNIKDYGSVEQAVYTYGFIFGKKTINYLKENNKHTIKWKWRIYYNLY